MSRKRRISRSRKVACIVCETKFMTAHSQGKYCSEVCRRKGWRKSWVEYNERNKKKRLAYGRSRYLETKSKRAKQINEYRKTPSGKMAQRNADQNNKRKFPEKIAARRAVRDALYRGILVRKPCEECGIKKVHAHHDDYSKPLKVRWLCDTHHKKLHKEV
jgi:hypothetical protein